MVLVIEFMFNGSTSFGNVVVIDKDLLFKYKFEAGKNYILTYRFSGEGPDKKQPGIGIYSSPSPKSTRPRDEDFITAVTAYRQ